MSHKLFVLLGCMLLLPFFGMAQKYAFVDTEYILNKIPSYRSAKEAIDQLSTRYQQEIEQGMADIQKRVKDFQAEQVLLTSARASRCRNTNKGVTAKVFRARGASFQKAGRTHKAYPRSGLRSC